MDDDLRKLIFQAIDETISKEDFERLQDAIETDSQVREVYLNAVGLCDSLAEIAVESLRDEAAARLIPTEQTLRVGSAGQSVWRFNRLQLAVAASLMALVAGGAFWIGRWNPPATPEAAVASAEALDEQTESQIAVRDDDVTQRNCRQNPNIEIRVELRALVHSRHTSLCRRRANCMPRRSSDCRHCTNAGR